jgi:hypothetical protein
VVSSGGYQHPFSGEDVAMGLLSGAVSISRFNVRSLPKKVDFEQARFMDVVPGSEQRASQGFVPMVPGGPYEVGAGRHAFRVRMDRLRADPTLLQERFRELVRAEIAAGAFFVGAKRRRELREQAEEELVAQTLPTSRIVEGCLDGKLLYVASTAADHLGVVTQLLRRIGVVVEPKAPWIDRGDAGFESSLVPNLGPGQSVLGCRLLRELVGDMEVAVEQESGYVRIRTADTTVTLSGAVFHELLHYLELEAEIVAANMVAGDVSFRFDALSYRVSNLKVDVEPHEHWTQTLDARLEKFAEVYELLDRKFFELGVDVGV